MRKLKGTLLEALREGGLGVEAGSSWKKGAPVKMEKVCLRILSAKAEEGAAYRYLGCDEAEEECYGMKLTVEFSLVLLSPKADGGDGAEAFAEEVMELLLAGIAGMPILEISLDEAEYDGLRDCFRQEIRVKTAVLASGVVSDETLQLQQFRMETAWK